MCVFLSTEAWELGQLPEKRRRDEGAMNEDKDKKKKTENADAVKSDLCANYTNVAW